MRRAIAACALASLIACDASLPTPRTDAKPATDGQADGSTPDGSFDGPQAGPSDASDGASADAAVEVLVVGYNFGDPTTPDATLGGHALVAQTPAGNSALRIGAAPGVVSGWATEIAPTTFVPAVDDELAKVLNHHFSVTAGATLTLEQGLTNGAYQVYTYHLENTAGPRAYDIAIQGNKVTTSPVSLQQHRWIRLGPFAAAVEDGRLTIALVGANDSSIAGLEITSRTPGAAVQALPSSAGDDGGVPGDGAPADVSPPAGDVGSGPTGPSPVDMTGWTLVFEDTFTGTSLDTSKWRQYGTVPSGSPPIYFNNGGITVNDGFVGTIWSAAGQWYGPGLQTWDSWVTYRAEIKARIPKGNGVGPYFLMWPDNDDWPPEFDLVECPGDTDQVMTTWHWQGPGGNGDDQYAAKYTSVDRTQWHVYTVEHTATGFQLWIDGAPQQTPAEWNQHNDTSHAMGFGIGAVAFPAGSGGDGWFGAIDGTTPDPYHFYVAYVRVWTTI